MATRADQVAEPKHKVFLCHSGAQKDFVEQLYVDLKRVSYIPFFDRSHESLPEGATFPDRLFDAIRKCRLFVFVLSEDFFTKTKWPMMELAAAVAAQKSENPNLKLLPLFFKISVPELKVEERRAVWFKRWTDWASETSRIDVTKWKEALKVVEVWSGIEFTAGMGEVAYREGIVDTVCRICPNIVFDVSDVVGRERFCQIVSHKFDELKCETKCGLKAPHIIGLFGMGGLGKTTLCKVMCNHYFAEFGGNVIHIDLKLNTIVDQQNRVIAKLTGATKTITDPDEGHERLKGLLSMHKVFLALDNVTDAPEIFGEVLWYLSVSYGLGSMILVTSRSCDILRYELKIAISHCLEVPDLNESEAISLFLQGPSNKHLELSLYSGDEQLCIVEGVRRARFTRKLRPREQFHPLALKALASRLGRLIDEPEQWWNTLANLDLKFTQHKVHPIFSILGSSFEMLPKAEKLIFMDVALFKPSCAIVKEDIYKWLSLVHQLTYEDIEEHFRSLRRKSLLEEGLGDEETKPINMDKGATTSIGGLEEMEMYSGSNVVVHDLYVDFAKLECKAGSLDKIECFAHEDCKVVPRQMKEFPSAGSCWPLKRICLIRGRFSECRFGEYYKNVVVLKLEYLTALIDLNVEGMFCLVSVDILCCYELRNIHGLQTLKELAWLRVARCKKVEVLPNLQALPALEHVEVRNTSQEKCPIISNCPQLYELRLSGHYAVKDLSNIQALDALQKVMIEWCPKLCTLPMLQDFQQLHELCVLDCLEVGGVMEIGSLVALRTLHLRSTNITELGGVGLMTVLCHLICEQCPLLHKLSDKIGALTKLTLLRLSKCPKLDGVLAVGSLLALQKLHLYDIAITELNGVGKLRCLCELVWCSDPIRIPKSSCELSDVGGLTAMTKLRQLCILADFKSFNFEDFRPLQRLRNFLQDEVQCDMGDVNHVMEIMTQQAMVDGVETREWFFMVVQSAFDVVEEIELGNDIIFNAHRIPHVTIRNQELQTILRFFYGVSPDHVNECVPGIGSPMRIVSFTEDILQGPSKPDQSSMHFKNMSELYLEDLEIGHLRLIGPNCLSKLYIRRCKRLLRPVILEAMMALEDVKMEECEYLDDACSALRIRECAQLRKVTIIKWKKLRPIFVSKVGSSDDFQNLPIEEISNVQGSTNPVVGIEWCHNMHVKVNIGGPDDRFNNRFGVRYGREIGCWIFELYLFGALTQLERSAMEFMRTYVGSLLIKNDAGQLRCWTCIVLQSTSTLPEENCMHKFDAILGRSLGHKISLNFEKRELDTRLFFFSGLLHDEVLQYLPDNWKPIRIVSFTGDKFQILNQEDVSMQVGSITKLCLNEVELDYKILSRLKCLSRLKIQSVTSSTINISNMVALEYVYLVDFRSQRCKAALSVEHCPRLQEVVLDRCDNVKLVFDTGRFNTLQKLVIKDCPDLVDIHSGVAEDPFPELKEVQVINCPMWRGPTWNHEGNQPCRRRFTARKGEVPFKEVIVEPVSRICPNRVFDVSRVVGRERFSQIVSHKFDKIKGEGQWGLKAPHIIGLLGMGGLGKTTLCKVMCNHYFAEFGGNVIHIDLTLNTIVDHQKRVILTLTGAAEEIIDPDEGDERLKNLLSRHKVFLALDNVTDDWIILEEVLWYLSIPYGVGSMILVTARSLEVLSELPIAKSHCMEVPDLNESEAISLFLQSCPSNKHLELSSYAIDEQLRVVEVVKRALFTRRLRPGEQFHPLSLKALASRLGILIDKPEQWRNTLENLDLKFTLYKAHPIFSILGSSFEMLPEEEKLIFMDVALFKPSCAIVKEDICKWLSLVHQLTYEDIEEHLRSLRKKSLLEEGLVDEETKPINMDKGATTSIGGLEEMEMYSGSEVVVNELYGHFAKLECKTGSLDKIECFAHEDCNVVPRQMKGFPSAGSCWPLKRIALIRGQLRSLSEFRLGEYYKNVVVLKLEYLTALIDLNVEGMNCLASVDILCCNELRTIHGLQTLKELAWLRVARCDKVEEFPNLQDLPVLKHVEVRITSHEKCPIISNCPLLYEPRLSGHYAVKDLSNIQALDALRKVMIEWCPKLRTLPIFQDFWQLHELYVLDCPELGGVMEIGSLVALRNLHLRSTNITELGGVGLLRDLCHLICEHCPKLNGVLAVGSLLALEKLHLYDIAITELNGVGKLRCLCELVWCSDPKRIPRLSCELSDVGGLTAMTKLRQLCILADFKSFNFEDFRPLQRLRNFLQDEVQCDMGDVNHVMEIMTQQAMVDGVETREWFFMVVQSAFDVVEEIELGNDIIFNAHRIPHVTIRNQELQTILRFFYGVSPDHVNECVPGIGSPMRIVSFTEDILQGPSKPDQSSMHFKNMSELYLEDLEIGHLRLIGPNCLSKLYIRRCKRLLRPVILEAMMALEDVKMEECEYLDDACSALRIRECAQLRKVTIIEWKKLRPIFVSKVGSSDDFQNLPIEEISNVQGSTNPVVGIEWCHNMHVKVNIGGPDDGFNNRFGVRYGREIGCWIFELYLFGALTQLERSAMEFMTTYVGSLRITNDAGQLRCWTCIVLQSTSTLPEENCMHKFDAILGRSLGHKIALNFEKRELDTRLFFFSGLLHDEVLQYLPDNWKPIRIVSFTGDKFQILNQEDVSMQVGSITKLCLNEVELDYKILSRLECLSRLEIQNVTSSTIDISNMVALQYVRLVDFVHKRRNTTLDPVTLEDFRSQRSATALRLRHCPRLQEVVLDNCANVKLVFDTGIFNTLQKLVIKDCPDLVDIHSGIAEDPFPELKEVQVINCPMWRGSTWNHEGNQPSGRRLGTW